MGEKKNEAWREMLSQHRCAIPGNIGDKVNRPVMVLDESNMIALATKSKLYPNSVGARLQIAKKLDGFFGIHIDSRLYLLKEGESVVDKFFTVGGISSEISK